MIGGWPALIDATVHDAAEWVRDYHWRDGNGHEVDAIVTLHDGRWAAFAVKMNPADADNAADSLLRFRDNVDTTKVGDPVVLGVITTTGYAFRRPDGIQVIR